MKLNQLKALKLIVLLALFNSSFFIAFNPQGFSLLRILISGSMLLSVFLLIIFFIKSNFKKWSISLYFKIIFSLLIVWSIITITRSINSNTEELISLFGHYLMGWAWIPPLAIFFGFNIWNWIKIFDFLSQILLVGISLTFISIVFFNGKYGFGVIELLQIFPFLLLTFFYQKRENKVIIVVGTLAFVLISIFNSQRVNALLLLMSFLFFMLEYIRQQKISHFKKIASSGFLILIMLFAGIRSQKYIEQLSQNDEITTDTRTFLFLELFSDLNENEVIMGRGALGKYYSPFFEYNQEQDLGGDAAVRSSVEVGYLEMILKGGFIMILLQILILIPAAILGIFYSKNSIARMSGYVILMYVIIYSVSYYPVYSAEYILLWMAVGTAISSKVRNIPDKVINVLIKQSK